MVLRNIFEKGPRTETVCGKSSDKNILDIGFSRHQNTFADESMIKVKSNADSYPGI